MPAPLIDIHNATVYRGDTCVFDGLSLTIDLDKMDKRKAIAVLSSAIDTIQDS